MIKHSPAENYLKYLVAHPACYDDLHIQSVAQELSLDLLGDWYMQWLRQRVKPPSPFYPEVSGHVPSERFMLREQITSAFVPDEAMERALRILCRPRIREVVETMMLSGAPNSAIVSAIGKRHQFRCDELAIKRYRHYFWNIELLDSVQMRALLDMRHSKVLDSLSKDVKNQYGSLHRMRHTDPRVVAAKLPHSPVAGLIAQMNAGVMPKRMDVAHIIDVAYTQALAKVAQHTTPTGGPQDAQLSNMYAMTADTMKRLKDAVGNPEDQLREDLHRIKVATTPSSVPTIRQLSSGQHTTDLQPEPKPGEVINVDPEDD